MSHFRAWTQNLMAKVRAFQQHTKESVNIPDLRANYGLPFKALRLLEAWSLLRRNSILTATWARLKLNESHKVIDHTPDRKTPVLHCPIRAWSSRRFFLNLAFLLSNQAFKCWGKAEYNQTPFLLKVLSPDTRLGDELLYSYFYPLTEFLRMSFNHVVLLKLW